MHRGIKEGISFGVIAGLIFAVAQMLAAGTVGEPGLMPLRMIASVVLGERAMTTTEIVPTVVVALLVHVVLSALYGVVYWLIDGRLSPDSKINYGKQALLGMVFGVVLWLVNFQIIGRILYPWVLMPPQGLQMMVHALFFGLPLGVMFAALERRVRHGPPVMPTPI